jgi:hypothetical protein
VFLANMFGSQFDRILDLLGGINRTLGIAAVGVLVLLAGWAVWRIRRQRAIDRDGPAS